MTGDKRLKEIAVIVYLLIIPLVFYFKYFPTIVNSLITNVLFIALISSLVVLFVYGSFLIKKALDVYLLLPQTLIIAFVVRAVPHLRLSDTILEDSFYHYITAANALNFGVTNPGLSWWYTQIEQQLHWPMMHLLTVTSVLTSGIDIGLLFRFQEPLLGILFVLVAFILAKLILKNDGMALLSALIALSGVSVIYYQSEYHPQGLAYTYFIFVVYVFIKFRETKNRFMFGVFLIFVAALVISHHFSSLFIGLYAIGVILITFAFMYTPRVRPEFRRLIKGLAGDYIIWFLIAVSALAYHFLTYIGFVSGLIEDLSGREAQLHVLSVGPTVPALTTFFNASSYILLLLAGVSLLFTVRTQNITRIRAAVLTMALLIVGFAGNYTGAIPYSRTVGFYSALGAVFVAITAFSIKDKWFPSINKSLKTVLVIVLICIPIVTGILGSQDPAYFFKDSDVNTYYFSSNDLSSVNRANTTGTWIHQHANQNASFASEFDTLPAVFYYGMQPDYGYWTTGINAIFINKSAYYDYVVVNPSIPYLSHFNKTAYLNGINVVFDDGILKVGDING